MRKKRDDEKQEKKGWADRVTGPMGDRVRWGMESKTQTEKEKFTAKPINEEKLAGRELGNGVIGEGGGLVYNKEKRGDVKRETKREKKKNKKRWKGKKTVEEGNPSESDNKVGITWTEMVMIRMMMTTYTKHRAPPDSWGRCLCISLYLW